MKVHLFALQVFLPLEESRRAREELLGALRGTAQHASFDDKRAFWSQVARALLPASAHFARGVWDWVTDSDRAVAEYESWTESLTDDVGAPAHTRPDAGLAFREGGGERFMFVTALVLAKAGGAADHLLAEACDLPERDWFARSTFARLLLALPELNFATVRADALIVRPGVESAAVTELELAEEQFGYVRHLV